MKTTLKIYLAPSGQWSGRVTVDGVEVCGIAGCDSPDDVEAAAIEQGYIPDSIETV